MNQDIYKDMNPGIVKTVRWLREAGFKTCDSGDGETHDHECDQSMPYVHMLCDPVKLVSEADRLCSLLQSVHGVACYYNEPNENDPCIQATYNPGDRTAILSLYNIKL